MPITCRRRRIDVTGIVQGVGFRPFVFGLASELKLTGVVWNHSAGVTIEVEGPPVAVSSFISRLRTDCPPLAAIDDISVTEIPVQTSKTFLIVESKAHADTSTPISPDMAVCDECLAEMRNPRDRRFGYPFINCTNCGPRFTIIRDLPYDRPQTTMQSFGMCELCAAEYHNPGDRRFHAQPNACSACGPHIWFVRTNETANERRAARARINRQSDSVAVELFHDAIRKGQIVAVKGIGGFHLACDARRSDSIAKLRDRKGRAGKPFAVMVPDLQSAGRIAHITAGEERLLLSQERPVVLLRRRDNGSILSELVAPGNDFVGVMLPYSPLHHLLLAGHVALVMTSGNLTEEPIVRTNEEAVDRLAGLADAYLLHDREIYVGCDDSVVRVFDGHELPIRRSRGYAPLPIRLTSAAPSVLAVGGELKATFCVTKHDYAYHSQHIGDLGNLETLSVLDRTVDHFCRLFRVKPVAVACDMHPGYLSTRFANDYGHQAGIPVIPVQHHHAHIAGVRAEHNCTDAVIGICFDGTGYGSDAAIWGGEVLSVDEDSFTRLAHLKYVPLPGGDAAIKRPYRAALAHLWAAGIAWDQDLPCVAACPPNELSILRTQLERNLNCVATSSMGRLFDAVASLIGVRHQVTYEAQAAMEMEALSARDRGSAYHFELTDAAPIQIDSQPVLEAIVADLRNGKPQTVIAGRFHQGVANVVSRLSRHFRKTLQIDIVAVSGGVFQNVLLLEQVVEQLTSDEFRILLHRRLPPNDGGIALGQAVVAHRTLSRGTGDPSSE